MDQETWKLVLAYVAEKERNGGRNLEVELLEQDLKDWAGNDPDRLEQLEQALHLWEDTATLHEDHSWQESFASIKQQLEPAKTRTIKKLNWLTMASAAAITGALVFFVFKNQKQQPVSESAITWITEKAAEGKIINILLPDSSEIWLNAGSSISFPKNLKHAAIRTVKLNGEAFFKVKRDPAHPFVVRSQNIQTRVLGTSFNIRAWKNNQPEVTVLTGKVAVSRDSAGKQSVAVHLLPNQQVIYDLKSNRLRCLNVEDAQASVDWRVGKMYFDRTPMEEVFQTISRKYAVKIISDQSFDSCELTAKFNNVSISEVLRTLALTFNIHYTINKQTIYIKGGKCN
ncbi:FecR family protein [Pedobacter sp. AJM]|uniref:FecR family protein n=1 Tax=Pedobacter sp. AJM TaxID=2003629 RepID=UPI000B4B6CDB|nr:FecR domain-containing protein [Pedobacter sp. AJM]OWK71364.1 hypothetical protein CBW18_09915 [Pedobacter sp. AJM]